MKRFLDRCFLARIDRALDDGEPLVGWTRWYVLRSPALREYYRSMLDLELELRFPENAKPMEPTLMVRQTIQNAAKPPRRYFYGTITVLLVLLAVGLGIVFMSRSSEPDQPLITKKLGPMDKINLDDVFQSIGSPLASFSRTIPDFKPLSDMNELSSLDVPVAKIVDFTESPFDTTLNLFVMARETFLVPEQSP